MKLCGIYLIVNTTNSKVLVGSSADIKSRWQNHRHRCRRGNHANPHFQRAWNKFTEAAFEFMVLEECPISSLVPREDYWMSYYKSLNPLFGYNMRGASGGNMSPEIVEKIRRAKLGQRLSEDTRQKIAKAHLGVPRGPMPESVKHKIRLGNLGRKVSEETRSKMREANLRRGPVSEETREKLRRVHLGRHMSDETKAKMRLLHLGKKMSLAARQKMSAANKGRFVSAQTRAKMSMSRKGHVVSDQTRAKMSLARTIWYQKLHASKNMPPISHETTQNTVIFPLEKRVA